MLKKILYFSIILIIVALFINTVYANDILMDLENANSTANESVASNTEVTDDTTYSSNETTTGQEITDDTYEEYQPTTTTTDYEESSELSISNIINIVLISVGVVLILLGIAVIIKLK